MVVILGEPVKKWKCIYKVCKASCCKIPRKLTLSDIKKIAEKTGRAPEDFVSITKDEDRGIPFVLKRKGDECIFLGKDYQCELHDKGAKPLLCRMYPFMLHKIIYGDEPVMLIKRIPECPGYGEGSTLTEEFLDEIKRQGQTYVTELRKIIKYRQQGINPEEIIQKKL